MDVDEAQGLLGEYGRYQVLWYVIICLATNIPGCWHTLATFFHGIVPEHHCKVPADLRGSSSFVANQTMVPFGAIADSYSSRCLVYVNLSISNSTQKCSEAWNDWEYSGDVTETIVSKWNLVCDRAYLVKVSQSVLVFGVMTGAMLFSTLSDHLGRKPVFLHCQWMLVVVGVVNAFVSNHYVYLLLRFMTGAFQQGLIVIGTIMVCELFSAKQRTFAGIIIEDFWALSSCLLPLLSYLIPNWVHLQVLISLSGLLTIPLFWFMPESIPWLCANDRVAEAELILERAARMNGIADFPKHVLTKNPANGEPIGRNDCDGSSPTSPEGKSKSESFIARCGTLFGRRKRRTVTEGNSTVRYTLLNLVGHRMLRTHAVVMGTIWLVITYVYYGLTLNTKELAGNRYLNFFLIGLIEIPAYTSSYFILNKWGRRIPLLGFHILAGVPLLFSVFIPEETEGGVSLVHLKTVCMMIGKFGITAAFGIVFLYSPELFPTTLRSQGTGISSFCGRIGNMIAPFATSLDVFAPWLSSIVYGTVSIGGGLLVLLLPETLNRPLPQSIEEIEAWSKTTQSETSLNSNSIKSVELKTV